MEREPRDRSGMLLALGIIQIVLGGLAALLSLLGLAMGLMAPMRAHPIGSLVPMLIYSVPAANLLATGIGTVAFRAWARPATLISSGIWLAIAAVGLGAMVIAMTMEMTNP